ncbi:MAG TPA: hypothetical protein VMQ81_00265 [Acidimicrobiia bacterium]|nr:hypothetical protein [Acidimicrobiia bacterium]
MGHARAEDLDRLERVLKGLRALDGLVERRRGVFCRGSTPFVHFHVFSGEPFGDLKVDKRWLRYPVGTAAEQRVLVTDARRVLKGVTSGLRGMAQS